MIPVVCESYHRLFDGKTRMERGVLKVKGASGYDIQLVWAVLTVFPCLRLPSCDNFSLLASVSSATWRCSLLVSSTTSRFSHLASLDAPTVLPPISTDGMTAADVGKLTEQVRDQMLSTLREISTPSPEASTSSAEAREESQQGESEPLLRDSRTSYTAESSGGARRRSPSSKSVESEELAQTGAVDARALASDLKDSAKRAVREEGEGETEDEMDEGGVVVRKPN